MPPFVYSRLLAVGTRLSCIQSLQDAVQLGRVLDVVQNRGVEGRLHGLRHVVHIGFALNSGFLTWTSIDKLRAKSQKRTDDFEIFPSLKKDTLKGIYEQAAHSNNDGVINQDDRIIMFDIGPACRQ